VVLGISPDSVKKQARFSSKQALPFTLVADEDHSIAEAYGVWKEKNFMGRKYMGVDRSTFVIDRDGVVRHIFPKVNIMTHANDVLDAINSLK
jgi:peroxiredoxin Q/BCP